MNTTRSFILITAVLLLLSSCQTPEQRPTTALDTGRAFIRASLDGNLDVAETLVAPDSLNQNVFASYRQFYKTLSAEQKNAYKKASYTVNNFRELNDSVTIINYSNDYMKKPMEIRLVRQQGKWNVDFSFTSGDTAPAQ